MVVQSTSSCSESLTGVLVYLIAIIASYTEEAEKAQQDPQDPWFFTGVSFPVLVQSITPFVINPGTFGGAYSELEATSAKEFEDEVSSDLKVP